MHECTLLTKSKKKQRRTQIGLYFALWKLDIPLSKTALIYI